MQQSPAAGGSRRRSPGPAAAALGWLDLAAILSATAVMWIALAEASALAQTAPVVALPRWPALPPRPRWLRARREFRAVPDHMR